LPQVLVHPFFKLVTNRWILSWRLALVNSYLLSWRMDGTQIENGAQRVHEDTQRFARGLQTCFVVVLDSVLTLLVFTPLLVRMGAEVQPSELPDAWLLLLCASISVVGIGGSVLFGWSLVSLEVENQKVEAELRKDLVILEEEPRAMCGSARATQATGTVNADMEIDVADSSVFTDVQVDDCFRCPLTRFGQLLAKLKTNYTRLYNRFAVFSLWLGCYEQIVAMLPYAMTAPLLFCTDPDRRISLGKVTQLSNAFSHVFSALNILSDNWVDVTDWLSVLRRLREWESHLAGPASTGTRTLISPSRTGSVRTTEMQRS
jgi:peptide/bleomycin uptake transporter